MPEPFPNGVVLITRATSVRYFGWGIVEALIPVFLYSLTRTYAETGILTSAFSIMLLLALPFAGILSERWKTKTVMILGLVMYPLIGAGYFIAGATGIIAFVVFARLLNGAAFALDDVGRKTYFRNHIAASKIAEGFGYLNTVTNFWWIVGLVCSIILTLYFDLHWLFIAIPITTIVSIIMLFRLTDDDAKGDMESRHIPLHMAYYELFKEVRSWSKGLRLLGGLAFFLTFLSEISGFLVPIYAYTQGASIPVIVLITILLNLPTLLDRQLGKIADRHAGASLAWGMACALLLLGLFAFTKTLPLQVGIALSISVVLQLMSLAVAGLATTMTQSTHYGRVSAAFDTLETLESVIGPVVVGLLLDAYGVSTTIGVFGVVTAGVLTLLLAKRRELSKANVPLPTP